MKLRGWGLCLDTFEATTPLNSRIPLLILERGTCNLGEFHASSNYDNTSYEIPVKICADIGNGLGGLHRGNVSHGDLNPRMCFFSQTMIKRPRIKQRLSKRHRRLSYVTLERPRQETSRPSRNSLTLITELVGGKIEIIVLLESSTMAHTVRHHLKHFGIRNSISKA